MVLEDDVTYQDQFDLLANSLTGQGLDVPSILAGLRAQEIETPSWGYANSGTRFKNFAWPGAARTIHEKIDDAAMVHRMTGIAPAVAIHVLWDRPEDGDYGALCEYAEAQGVRIGAVNPNLFEADEYRLGALANPNPSYRQLAIEHMLESCEIMTKVGSDVLSLWFAGGTNYAGQDSLRERKHRFEDGLAQVYDRLPESGRMLLEYKLFEPAFYSTDIPDWGTSYALSLKLGDRAQVLMDLGHHASCVNIEQIVAFLLDEGKLGGFHFNNRKYADDDLIVGSVNPYELFLIFNELAGAALSEVEPGRTAAANVAYMIDQSHNIEGKLAPMILSVLNCQEAYAKSLLVRREELATLQQAGEVLAAHCLLNEAYRTDVRPLLAKVREEMGVPTDPISTYLASGYGERVAQERGTAKTGGGYQR
jgi:L-rhamnose isomerase/sugar isomerase